MFSMVGNNTIKSYVIRRGRMSPSAKNNYAQLAPIYCIPYSEGESIDFAATFGNDNPVIIEIGFGMGDTTATIAKNNPNVNYIGIEVHTPGVARLLGLIKDGDLNNLKIIEQDAIDVLENMVQDNSVAGFHIFFSDPWPKMRHHKRRLMQRVNIELFSRRLKQGGYIYFVTDVEDYAISALKELSSVDALQNEYEEFSPHKDWRPVTKFERAAIENGREIREMYFRKK